MTPDPASALGTLAATTLQAVIDHYDSVGVKLPDRRLLYPGVLPAFDCEFLGVGIDRTFNHQGDVALEVVQSISAHAGWALQGATVAIWLVRCTPIFDDALAPPTVEDLSANAFALWADEALIREAIIEARPDLTSCNGIAFVDWNPVDPQGAFAGGVARVRMSLA